MPGRVWAHFLEHMIFKGTDRLPPGKFDQIIENRGGVTNAATSYDYAHYYINTAAADLPETLPCLADLLVNAAIPDEEFRLEREVVLEEIRQSQDDPDGLGFQSLMENVYRRHPYGRPILGDPETLMARSPEEMRCFHRAHYQPENMTVVVVGDVGWESALEEVEKSFSFSSPAVCPHPTIWAEPPMTDIRRQELSLPRLEQARLLMAWMAPGVEDMRTAYGLDLLSVLLAGGRTSRLVQELREERQLVQDIGSGFSLQRDSSLFTLTAWLEPQHLAQVEAIIGDRLSELAAVAVSEAELNRYKRLLCKRTMPSRPRRLAKLRVSMATTIRSPKPVWSVRYPGVIQSFQPEELRQLASQYLSPLRYAATVLLPIPS